MKIKIALIVLTFICSAIHNAENRQIEVSIIDSKFPLFLDKIDLENHKNSVKVNDGINAKINKTVADFYRTECNTENQKAFSVKDCYIKTIRLKEKNQTVFFVMLQSYPTHELRSKILFYNNVSKEFIGEPIDFKIYALYDCQNGKIKSSNLKKSFKIKTPEMELVDFDKDGINEFKLTRLFHNGTFNAIETKILKVTSNKIEVLYDKQKGIGISVKK